MYSGTNVQWDICPVGQMSVGQLSVGLMSVGQMSHHRVRPKNTNGFIFSLLMINSAAVNAVIETQDYPCLCTQF